MTAQTKTVTEGLSKMPDAGLRRGLVRGKPRETTPTGDGRGYLALETASEPRNHVKANKLGLTCTAETGFKISPVQTPCAPRTRPS